MLVDAYRTFLLEIQTQVRWIKGAKQRLLTAGESAIGAISNCWLSWSSRAHVRML